MADGLSARELATLAGISLSHPTMIETGQREHPTGEILGKLAPVLGVTMEWLVSGAGEEPTRDSVRAAVARARTEKTAGQPTDHAAALAASRRRGGPQRPAVASPAWSRPTASGLVTPSM